MSRVAWLALLAVSCNPNPPGLDPTPPAVLTPPTAGTHDEDPSLLRARDGSFHLAWLSDRDGNDDLYVMRSTDAVTWGTPVRVTHDANPDWYPRLIQTHDGRFRLVWMRANAAASPRRWIMTSSSADGLTWDAASEVMITDGSADDWAPCVVETSTGELLVYYSRGGDLYLSLSPDQGATWQSQARLTTASDPSAYDVFPAVVERAPHDLVMVWVRYAASGGADYFNPSSNLMTAASTDGIVWTQVAPLMSDGFVDSVPNVYADGAGYQIIWTSTSGAPAGKLLELPLGGAYPGAAVDVTAARGMNGWSAAVAPTGTPGIDLAVWVNGDPGSKRLSWRLFAR